MTASEIKRHIQQFTVAIENRKLKTAFDILSSMLANLQNWQLNDRLNHLQETYRFMLNYAGEGTQDPLQNKVYLDLVKSAYELSDDIWAQIKLKNVSNYAYDQKRVFTVQQDAVQLSELTGTIEDITGKETLLSLLPGNDAQTFHLKKEIESLTKKIFEFIWLKDDISNDEKSTIHHILLNEFYPTTTQSVIISALTLGLINKFDENKIELILDACENQKEEIRQRAIVGLLVMMQKYDKRLHLYTHINNRIAHLGEDNTFISSVINIIIQFIISKDTEKITRRINEEILPEMLKLNSDLNKKLKLDDLLSDPGVADKNPDWKSFIEEAQSNNKLQEFSELQMSGADVTHSSFAHLKSYPFFNELSNWFLPFSTDHSVFYTSNNSDLSNISDAILNSSFLCNSDKYSFFLSIMQMPESMRKMMSTQFSSESEAMKELEKSELPGKDKKFKTIANNYIRDLYRFFKLHPRKQDFEDIFAQDTEFFQVESIYEIIGNEENLQLIGEYYFSKNYYKEAIEIFDLILAKTPNNAVIIQKRAYAKQMSGSLQDALNDYLTAEILDESNSWTIKKIAYCYRMLKKPEDALLYYRKVEKLNPNNLSIQLNIGHCYLELKDYAEALKCYFKVEYLEPNNTKSWRPIAWCSFLTGKYEQALDYYQKILGEKPDSLDYLNAGHVFLAMKDTKNALKQYVQSAYSFDSFGAFETAFNEDMETLKKADIDIMNIPLLLDLIQYKMG